MIPRNPRDLGLPFDSFRPAQYDAIRRTHTAFTSGSPVVALSAPTGAGKSLIAGALQSLTVTPGAGRGCALTGTKALEDQYLDTYSDSGLVNIRGRNNYECGFTEHDCDFGRIAQCPDQRPRDGEPAPRCPYTSQLATVLEHHWYTTNYRYQIEMQRRDYRLGAFDLQVCDEAHEIVDVVTSAAAVTFTKAELAYLDLKPKHYPEDIPAWAAWATERAKRIRSILQTQRAKQSQSGVRKYEALLSKIETVTGADADNWAVDPQESGGVKFEPIDVSAYAHAWLFDAAVHNLLMSATLTTSSVKMLGFSPGQFQFIEVDSEFDPALSPFYVVPRIQVKYTMDEYDKKQLLSLCNQIIGRRLDRKGIVHSVSYERARWIKRNSQFAEHIITHEPGGVREAVEQYKAAAAPAILVSPAVMTGYDFPGDECDYQIIIKLPWPDNRGSKNLMDARKERLPLYNENGIAQKVIQASGRGTRSKEDKCETFLLDKMAQWFIPKYAKQGMFPRWWMKRWSVVEGMRLPDPL